MLRLWLFGLIGALTFLASTSRGRAAISTCCESVTIGTTSIPTMGKWGCVWSPPCHVAQACESHEIGLNPESLR